MAYKSVQSHHHSSGFTEFKIMNEMHGRANSLELKEQNFIQLINKHPKVSFVSNIDCTLRLGLVSNMTQPPFKIAQETQNSMLMINHHSPQVMRNYMETSEIISHNIWRNSSICHMNESMTRFSVLPNAHINEYAPLTGSSMIIPDILMDNRVPFNFYQTEYFIHQNVLYQSDKRCEDMPLKCHSCNATSTPKWRRGPKGYKTLCNACGIRYCKILKKVMEFKESHTKYRAFELEKKRKKPMD